MKSDAKGILRIQRKDIKDQYHIMVLRHPVFGIGSKYMSDESDVWRVGRGFDVPVLVRDWRGQAVPGARIGFCGGCGHSPDLINATCGPDGVAILRGIDPHNGVRDVYVQHPGLSLGYDSVDWSPGSPPWVLRCSYSPAVSGKVVDMKGNPVGGAYVSAREVHRGPGTRTAADGTFTLHGSEDGSICKITTSDGAESVYDDPEGYPVTLTVPTPQENATPEGSVFTAPGDILPEVKTRWIRVQISDKTSYSSAFPNKPYEEEKHGFITVPLEGEFVIRVETGWVTRSYHYAEVDDLPAQPLTLAAMPLTKVRGRVIDRQGKSLEAKLNFADWHALERSDSENKASIRHTWKGQFALLTHRAGQALLRITPSPEDSHLRARLIWVSLPLRAVDVGLDLGDIVLDEEPTLSVLDHKGEALIHGDLKWARAGMQMAGRRVSFSLDSDGEWNGPDLHTGDALWIMPQDKNSLAHHVVLRGAAPWKIRLPGGQLTLRVTNQDGEEIDAACLIRGSMHRVDGEHTLRGLPSGALRLYLSAQGYKTAIVDTQVGMDPHSIDIVLPAR